MTQGRLPGMSDHPAEKEGLEAAHKAVDPDRLLPNENPDTTFAEDAEHWISVYEELLQYKDRLLAVTEATLVQLDQAPAGREVAETDRTVLNAERDRFLRRIQFWQRRLAGLRG